MDASTGNGMPTSGPKDNAGAKVRSALAVATQPTTEPA